MEGCLLPIFHDMVRDRLVLRLSERIRDTWVTYLIYYGDKMDLTSSKERQSITMRILKVTVNLKWIVWLFFLFYNIFYKRSSMTLHFFHVLSYTIDGKFFLSFYIFMFIYAGRDVFLLWLSYLVFWYYNKGCSPSTLRPSSQYQLWLCKNIYGKSRNWKSLYS